MFIVMRCTETGRSTSRFETLAEAVAASEGINPIAREVPCPFCGGLDVCSLCIAAADTVD